MGSAVGSAAVEPKIVAQPTGDFAQPVIVDDNDEASPHRSGSPASAESLLRRWLRSLKILLPDLNRTIPGYRLVLSGGVCSGLDLASIRTSTTGSRLRVDATGVAISCALGYSAQSDLSSALDVHGSVAAEINRSGIGGELALVPDSGSPPLPIGVTAPRGTCAGRFVVTQLRFSGGALSKFLDLLRGPISAYLSSSLAAVICDQVDALINSQGSEAVREANSAIRGYLQQPSVSPAPPSALPGPAADYVDLTRWVATDFAHRLVDRVVGNASSPHSLQRIVEELLGPEGNFSIRTAGVEKNLSIGRVGNLSVAVNALSFGNLTSASRLGFDVKGPHDLSLSFGMAQLAADVSVRLAVSPDVVPDSPLHGGTLVESFDAAVQLRGLTAAASFFLAANSRRLHELSADQLGSLGCIGPAVASPTLTGLDLGLALAQAAVTPRAAGELEDDVDAMFTAALDLVLRDYAAAVSALADHAASVTARDAANLWAQGAIEGAGACAAPASNYAAPGLSQAVFVAALGLALASAAASIFLTVGASRVRGSCRRLRVTAGAAAVAAPLTAAPLDGPGDVDVGDEAALALARHPRIPLPLRVCLPVLVVVTILLFVSSNSGLGCSVRLSISVDGVEAVELPPVFSFSLVSSVHDMWQGRVYALAILIAAFSGVWPYVKLVLMWFCWFAPVRRLSLPWRQRLLDFLDAYGKWSLVDTFVLVMFMVAFRFDLSGRGAQSSMVAGVFEELGTDAAFTVFIKATPGFYAFLVATLMSLVLGHAMTASHRYALRLGEYSSAEAHCSGRGGELRRLCDVLRPPGRLEGRLFAYGPVAAVGVSLLLVLTGIFMDTFQFRFLGLAGYVLGPEAAVRPYSVVGLDLALPGSADSDGFGVRFIQGAFIFFAAVVMPAYLALLLCLWIAPLPVRRQQHLLVATQVLNAWNGLDVFCLSILASVLEIRRFALFIVGDKCDLIDRVIDRLPFADALVGSRSCFDLESQLRPGFYVLAAAVVIASVVGNVAMDRCAKALAADRPGAASGGPERLP